MNFKTTLTALLIVASAACSAQCERTTFILAPGFYKYGAGNVGVGVETGLMPVASKTFLTLKANLWSQGYRYEFTNVKGEKQDYTDVRSQGFAGVKLNYAPQANESLPRKWAFGIAGGIAYEEGIEGKPAMELSTAYVIRMAAGSYNGGIAYLKLEGLCQAQPGKLIPGLGAGIFILL